ncbi:hypothetical protein [Pseudomonas sp. AN-1]|uniref:hypothetical protein n=1 Tax=Pseudomonas sp. AN-1 TaxID=3096605 RepID=UPI002A6A8592|nr:hypothetical protein [Pseudomonas sp. AN-1]WPP47714.1 hypothetical protein SK095_10270 [Pseudomonas sp. AN-1]
MNVINRTRDGALAGAFDLLPERMAGARAEAMLLAIGLQESLLIHRRQLGGPARGLLQFETGGVRGVLEHPASRQLARAVCIDRGIVPTTTAVYAALEHDDVLAMAIGRLLLWTDPKPLPELGDGNAAWQLYLRTWRPGAAERDHDNLQKKFHGNYARACAAVTENAP